MVAGFWVKLLSSQNYTNSNMPTYSLGVTAGTFNLIDVNSVSHSIDAVFAVIENQSVSVYLANGFYLIPPLFFDGIINDDTGLPFVSFPVLNTFVRNSFINIYDHYPSTLSSFADYYVNGGIFRALPLPATPPQLFVQDSADYSPHAITVDGGALQFDGAPIGGSSYTLPTASTTVLGGVMVDGTTITAASGVISAAGFSGITGWYEDRAYSAFQGTDHTQIGGGGSSSPLGADTLRLWRIMPVETVDIDGIQFMISTAGTAGALARVGIYAHNVATGAVGAPIVDSGGLAVTSAAGTTITSSITKIRLNAYTPYWAYMLTNNAAFLPRFLSGGSNANTTPYAGLDTSVNSSVSHSIRVLSFTYGTPPTDPLTAYTNSTNTRPGLFFRVARI